MSRSADEILIQAKCLLEQENYRMAILEAVIALEFTLSSIIRWKGGKRELPNGKVGVSQMFDIALKLLMPNLPSKQIISACKKANRLRNRIVHEGYLTVSSTEARIAVANIELFIQCARELIG